MPASVYELDIAIKEGDFRRVARERLTKQDEKFQERWLPRINDADPQGRLMGYTAVWTAMEVHENWQKSSSGTTSQAPYSRMSELDFVEPLSKEEREQITRIGEKYRAEFLESEGAQIYE